ncbi:MAG: 8-amino-7-oxononanoate synthase [Flavobacteriales bacterium]|nr:8-amino-7-oxononanoate synthase [Flavobacteriales bacterium]MBO73144.1 8-amino-7-oxononanoate synthase [Flavobacteriales bacterium]|tara:strand:+ start:505 stop:1605 length:1101 start_codon:yes stop_codon:yes gene_type:complete
MKFKKQKHLLTQREEANAFRFLSNRRGLIDFSSNDYLGLSKGGDEFNGIQVKGSGGSRLLAGNYPEIEQFEKFLSEFHKCESALMFNSGYNANVGFFSSVPQKGDTILYDELIHASVKDGMRLSFAKSYSFKHNSIDDLNKKLKHAEGDVYVVVEGVYSMDGDSAPLLDLANFCNQEGLILVVDEAHSIGVFGKCGEGLVQSLGIEDRVPIRIVTFGKAIGAHGAAVLSDATVKSFLINFCRSFIYTTALPPHTIQSLSNSYGELKSGTLSLNLLQNISLFKAQFSKKESKCLISSDSAIQCVLFPGNEVVKNVSGLLVDSGFDVRPVLSPTVKKGKERIRICIHTFNTENEIINLANEIKKHLKN